MVAESQEEGEEELPDPESRVLKMLGTRSLQDTRSLTQRDDLLRMEEMEVKRQRSLRFLYEWKEDSRGVSAARIQKHHNTQKKQEVQMANKELIMVRRAALRCLLQDEYLQYQEELARMGKTFYVDRH
ncbi:cilia- and flagella-associated protein 141 [Dendropsophus ebraccatus]|uniref:cilia- and flagella-associated protein 141 n=1 Tax=Dendropsophus ebraccatus TaxID=150705 RepID=UPI003830FD40